MCHPHGLYAYRLNGTLPAENNANGRHHSNTTYPVLCFCHVYGVCSCDNISFQNGTINGTTNASTKWNTSYAVVNGTEYSLLNGTLSNGTTAPGGAKSGSPALVPNVGWVLWTVFAVYLISLLN
jgi:hypothetical protein